jgi:signal transduction histidine kinase
VSLRRQLVFSFVVYALAILVATLVPFGILSSHAHRTAFVDDQRDDAQRVASGLGREGPSPGLVAERYEGRTSSAWLLDPRGEAWGDPTSRDVFPALLTNAPEVERARRGTSYARIGDTPAGRRVLVGVPIIQGGRLSGVLWVSTSLAQVARLDRQRWALLAAIGAAAMAGAAFVGMSLSRTLTRRLEVVAEGASRFGEGRLSERISVGGSDEIASLAEQLNVMAGEIDRLVEREKSFVAAASHQIRTPLAAIKIRIDELLAAGDMADRESIEYLKEMADEVDRLTSLTTRLLDLSAAERMPDARPLVASRAIREAVDRVMPLAQHHSMSITLEIEDEDTVISAPPGAFEEALFNLIDNAVKFSRPGAVIDVHARLDNGALDVSVVDRGPGIPTEHRGRVLDPFFRATRQKPGHGLGLAISARLCASSHATLALGERPGGGTIARIRWPSSAA